MTDKTNSKNSRKSASTVCTIFLFLAFCTTAAGNDYNITWYTIDGGGGTSSGGSFKLEGTVGQHDAAYSQGPQYKLYGGFWPQGYLCLINFDDYARFADYWLQSGTHMPADLYPDDFVDEYDLMLFADHWLCICPENWPLR